MSSKNLSTIATQVIEAYGITATNVINAYRLGGERVIGFIDERFTLAMARSAPVLNSGTRSILIDSQQRMSGFYVKGLHFGTDRAQSVVGVAIDLATKGVSLVASNATRLDRQTNLNALDRLNRAVMPAASLLNSVAVGIEEGSTELVKRVAGESMPAKAIATRKLNTAKRKAATSRKRITQVAVQQVDDVVQDVVNAVETSEVIAQSAAEQVIEQVNTQVEKAVAKRKTASSRKRVTKAAAQPVEDAVQDVANAVETSEVIAQSATEQVVEQVNEQVEKPVATRKRTAKVTQTATKAVTKRVSKAVADTAIDTSNAARSVARKAKKVADAAEVVETTKVTEATKAE